MSTIYRKNCDWCGRYYESWAKYFCGNSCASFYKHSNASFGFKKGFIPNNKYLTPRKCKECVKEFQPRLDKRKFCSKKCADVNRSKNMKMSNHPLWKGGKSKSSQGYVLITIKSGKQVLEHRHVMEKHLNRKLNTKEHVHHINGNKLDNRIDNLQVLSTHEHNKLHATRQWSKNGSLRNK